MAGVGFAGVRQYLPRFLLVLAVVPLLFAATALCAARLGFEPAAPAAAVGAVSFAAVALAPSSKNAAVRAALLGALVALAWIVALLLPMPA
jgi:hypothetical protein